jgi:hypothetical protein
VRVQTSTASTSALPAKLISMKVAIAVRRPRRRPVPIDRTVGAPSLIIRSYHNGDLIDSDQGGDQVAWLPNDPAAVAQLRTSETHAV